MEFVFGLALGAIVVGLLFYRKRTRPTSPSGPVVVRPSSSGKPGREDSNVRDRQLALQLMESATPFLFVHGRAGTGKSQLLREWKRTTRRKKAIVAFTGIAAVNVDGRTINSYFRFPPRALDQFVLGQRIADVRAGERQLYRALETIVVDEISMVRSDMWGAMDAFLRAVRESSKPFGGVQVIVLGDLFQLPPVVTNRDESQFLHDNFGGKYFFSTRDDSAPLPTMIELEHSYRHMNDPWWDNCLRHLREGRGSEADLERINSRVNPCDGDVPPDGFVALTGTNDRADAINDRALANLPGRQFVSEGVATGAFENMAEEQLPAVRRLRLKAGAPVMFLVNDNEGRWVNGTTGVVRGIREGIVQVSVMGAARETPYDVSRFTWKLKRQRYNQQANQIVEHVDGEFTQYPLALAWAFTIHKSQGKTIRNVFVDLERGAFEAGQLYVALSRCPTLDSLRLQSPISMKDARVDPVVVEYLDRLRQRQNAQDLTTGR